MKYISRILLISCLVVGMLTGTKAEVSAASVEIMVTPTDSANAGDTVPVRIRLNNNPGITTFGASLAYDSSVLTYNGATWLSSISSDSSNMLLVSDVEENGQQRLNISAVLNRAYSTSGETFVTLNFTAKQAYTSMPVTLEARDISDGNYDPVDASVVVERGSTPGGDTESQTGGSGSESESGGNNSESESGGNNSESESGGNNSESESGGSEDDGSESESGGSEDDGSESESGGDSESESGGNPDDDDSESESGGSSEPDRNGTGDKNGGSSDKNGTTDGKKNLDSTFKTGADDPKVIFGVIAILLVAGAGGCMVYLRRRKM